LKFSNSGLRYRPNLNGKVPKDGKGVKFNVMWKTSANTIPVSTPELARPASATPATQIGLRRATSTMDQANIGKGMILKGEITGSEPLFIDGCVEGSIDLPGSLVTIGRNAHVTATISAHDVVIMGTVIGNIVASNRLDIRAQANVTGDAIAVRMTLEQGASIKGRFYISRPEPVTVAGVTQIARAIEAPAKMRVKAQPEGKRMLGHSVPVSAYGQG